MKKWITIFVLIFAMLQIPSYGEEKLRASVWALPELNKANENGLISYFSKETLQKPIDRKNFAYTALMTLNNVYRVNFDFDYVVHYKDLNSANPLYPYISMAGHYGIIKGFNDGRFYPEQFISRRDTVVMLSRIARYFLKEDRELLESTELDAFMQSEEYEKLPEYAKRPVSEFISYGLLKGMSDGKYHLDDTISAEAAIILAYRYMNYIMSVENQIFSQKELEMIRNFKKYEQDHPIKKDIEPFKVYANIDRNSLTPATLSDDNYNNALNSMNRIRMAAGVLPVARDKDYDYRAAHGALILFATEQLSHYPEQRGLPYAIFKIGELGTSHSNLGTGYKSMDKFNLSCAYDDDANNIGKLGHRRWLINPNMLKTGFGMAGPYALTYVLDESREPKSWPQVLAYPSKTAFPYEYIKQAPFSIQFASSGTGENLSYELHKTKNPTIELTRLNDNQTTVLKDIDLDINEEDRSIYNVDRANNGYGPALIFSPKHEVKILDRYRVLIKGLIDSKTGEETNYEYEFILY